MSGEMSNHIFEYESIARVLFGPNARTQTGTEARNLTGGKDALIITDSGVLKAGLIDDIEASLTNTGFVVGICATVTPEPAVSDYLYRTNPNIVEFFEEWCKREQPTEAEATALFEDMF